MTEIACFDLDAVKYAAASVGESRTILVTHKVTGRTKEFKNKTEFHGRGKNKDGGWLGELNKSRDSHFTIDDFDIEDVQAAEPVENALHTAKIMVENAIYASKADKVEYFIGKGDSFRVERSTILKYKGQREAMIKPLRLEEVSDYLTKKYAAEVVTEIECDDRCVIETYRKQNKFILGLDKDFYGTTRFFNFNKPDEGIVDCSGFGKLWLDEKRKVRGVGRVFKLFQCCSSDSSDNYAANCASDCRWGQMSAFNALKNCTDDKELFKASVDVFKTLYPTKKTIKGWRGDDIEVTWLYVMQECFDMCHLHRKVNDWVDLEDVLTRMGIEIGQD